MLTLLSLLLPLAAPPPQDGATPPSLETALERARSNRDALLASLRPRVEELLTRLEETANPGRLSLEDLRGSLDQLGPEAALLLVPALDPVERAAPAAAPVAPESLGAEASKEEAAKRRAALAFRAEEVARALVRMHPPGVLAELDALARNGSPAGRRHAVEVLGAVPERERAGELLADLFTHTEGDLHLAAARSLGRVGAPEAILTAALRDPDARVVAAMLDALADAGDPAATEIVLALARDPAWGAKVPLALVRFWQRFPEQADAEVLGTIVALALRTSLAPEVRVQLLEAIPEFDEAKDRDVRRALEPLTQSTTATVREAALVAAVRLGDRGARRELLASFDEMIDQNERWWKGYGERGRVLLRIRDYSGAAKDLQRALDLLEDRARTSTHEGLWLDLARAYVLSGKLGKAADKLEELGLSRSVKKKVLDDPDFRPLVEHSRYGKLFE